MYTVNYTMNNELFLKGYQDTYNNVINLSMAVKRYIRLNMHVGSIGHLMVVVIHCTLEWRRNDIPV